MLEVNLKVEVTIVGGGIIGAALAIGLTQKGFEVLLLEQNKPINFNPNSPPDVRVLSICAASISLLKKLNVWDMIISMRCASYRYLKTWEWEISQVVFDAYSLGLSELGCIVENTVLKCALWRRLQQQNVKILCPISLSSIKRKNRGWEVILNNGKTLYTRLLIGADGANSQVRYLSGLCIKQWDYSQSCMLITVQCPQNSGNTTWQQFTSDGPRAFLPLFDHWASLAWYDKPTRIGQLQEMSIPQLKKEILSHFPKCLGKVEPIQSKVFSLVSHYAMQYIKSNLALIGDAAHSINPLAGQGVNIGLRDVCALIDILSLSRLTGEDWSSKEVLTRYQKIRKLDNLLMHNSIDFFYYIFSNQSLAIKIIRNLGLIAAEKSGNIKLRILRYALGL